MRDQDDGVSFLTGQSGQEVEEAALLFRGDAGGRLVENERRGSEVEQAQQLKQLAFAHGHGGHWFFGQEAHAQMVGELAQPVHDLRSGPGRTAEAEVFQTGRAGKSSGSW